MYISVDQFSRFTTFSPHSITLKVKRLPNNETLVYIDHFCTEKLLMIT